MKYTTSMLMAAGLAAAAETTTVSILMPMVDAQSLVGSVVSVGPIATVYRVSCPEGADSDDCGLPFGLDVTNGPSTMAYTVQVASETLIAGCSLKPKEDVAVCTATQIGSDGQSVSADELTGYSSFIVPVTITAGADKLSGSATTTGAATGGTSTGVAVTRSSNTSAGTGSTGTDAPAPTDAPTGDDTTQPTTTSASTGGVPQVTQNAVIMGAAALVGGAMML